MSLTETPFYIPYKLNTICGAPLGYRITTRIYICVADGGRGAYRYLALLIFDA